MEKAAFSGFKKSNKKLPTLALMLIATLFTIAKLWKQPRCPTTDE
jgi:hypothetical protein